MNVPDSEYSKRMSVTRAEILKRIQQFCLMDDEFMTVFFDNEPECMAFVLRIILEKPDLRVTAVHSQHTATNLHGRSARFDVTATDGEGRLYNIEVQRADRGAGAKRARFNSALLDTRTLRPGDDTERLPETYVIFITEHDVLKAGKAVYHINRIVEETGAPFGDLAHIVYVNNAYRANDAIGRLMHDFACRAADGMKNGLLAERARSIKSDEDKVVSMSYIVEELVNEAKQEARDKRDIETAAQLLERGKMTEMELAEFYHFTPEQLVQVKERLAVPV